MHTLLDYNGHLPAYVNITDGKTADYKGAYDIPLLKQSVVVADRFYNNFSLLNVWYSNDVFFVIRHKDNNKFTSIKENDLPDNRHQHILKDEIIDLTGNQSKMKYPKRLRRVAIWDDENKQEIELITNQKTWTANTISELYKARWQIEIFFREIKTTPAYKVFCRNFRKCCYDPDMDGIDHYTCLKTAKSNSKKPLVLVQFSRFIRLNFL